jgi:hypothetical protein
MKARMAMEITAMDKPIITLKNRIATL